MYTGTGDSGEMKIPLGDAPTGIYQNLSQGLPIVGHLAGATYASIMNYGRWQLSPKGLLWGVKQLGLQLLNPREETRLWNPLSPLASLVPTFHMDRHMNIAGFPGKREGLTLTNVPLSTKFPVSSIIFRKGHSNLITLSRLVLIYCIYIFKRSNITLPTLGLSPPSVIFKLVMQYQQVQQIHLI